MLQDRCRLQSPAQRRQPGPGKNLSNCKAGQLEGPFVPGAGSLGQSSQQCHGEKALVLYVVTQAYMLLHAQGEMRCVAQCWSKLAHACLQARAYLWL